MSKIISFIAMITLCVCCKAQDSRTFQFVSIDESHIAFINNDTKSAIFIQFHDEVVGFSTTDKINRIELHSKGLLVTDIRGRNFLYDLNSDLRQNIEFSKALYGKNFAMNRLDDQLNIIYDNTFSVLGIGVIALLDSGDLPESISCTCRLATISSNDCTHGGEGSTGCSVSTGGSGTVLGVGGGGGSSCSIECSEGYACCN